VYREWSDYGNLLDDLIRESAYLLLVITTLDERFDVGGLAFGKGHEITDGETITIFLVFRMHLK
jgi:hypothetical protein